jgi:hypothetical protein
MKSLQQCGDFYFAKIKRCLYSRQGLQRKSSPEAIRKDLLQGEIEAESPPGRPN